MRAAGPARALIGIATLVLLLAASVPTVTAQGSAARSIRYGEVLEVRQVIIKSGPTASGANTGATVGAVAGYALADGRGRWLGALVGGALGGAAGKRRSAKKRPGFELIIRLENGEEIAINVRGKRQAHYPGDRVRLMVGRDGNTEVVRAPPR